MNLHKWIYSFSVSILACVLVGSSVMGCASMAKGLGVLLSSNPEKDRIDLESQADTSAHAGITIASTKDQIDAHVKVREITSRGSHPSFMSSIVSGLYTSEGLALRGSIVAILGTVGALVWKSVQAGSLGSALNATIRGVQEYRYSNPEEGGKLKAILSQRHRGLRLDVARRVARVLRES